MDREGHHRPRFVLSSPSFVSLRNVNTLSETEVMGCFRWLLIRSSNIRGRGEKWLFGIARRVEMSDLKIPTFLLSCFVSFFFFSFFLLLFFS